MGDRAFVSCKENEVGEKIAECQKNGSWIIVEDDCVLKPIQELLDQSEVSVCASMYSNSTRAENVTLDNMAIKLFRVK